MFDFTEIDLSKTTRKGGDGLEVGPSYLVLYDGQFHVGTFDMQWYGLNFSGIYGAGAQYDPPGTNGASWQKIWRFNGAEEFAASLEMEYAEANRRYCIDHGMTSNGQKITEEAPIEFADLTNQQKVDILFEYNRMDINNSAKAMHRIKVNERAVADDNETITEF